MVRDPHGRKVDLPNRRVRGEDIRPLPTWVDCCKASLVGEGDTISGAHADPDSREINAPETAGGSCP